MGGANWIPAISALAAAAAFVFSVWVRLKTEKDTRIRDWQRVVIYSLIEERPVISFDDLKGKYLQRAQQLLSIAVPKKEIQDDALRRILLDLQKDNLVYRNNASTYQIQYKVPMEAYAFDLFKRMERVRQLKPKILSLVEQGSGLHTSETIVRKLQEQLREPITFDEVDEVISDLRGYASITKNVDGKLEFVPPYDERRT